MATLGPTGEYPEGQLHEDDKGELCFKIGHTPEGKVVLDWGTAVSWIAMPPARAREVATALNKHAGKAEELECSE